MAKTLLRLKERLNQPPADLGGLAAKPITQSTEQLRWITLQRGRELLDGEHCWQVHRSTIVNAHAIKSVSRALSGKLSITLKNRPESLEVSPAYSHRFKQL